MSERRRKPQAAKRTERPLLTATLIARDEKPNIRRCLANLWPHVDEVVIVDTGSKDGTLAEAKRFARERKQTTKLKTARFTDCNDEQGQIKDFASARQAADELATGRWLIWSDIDDTIDGLDELRRMVGEAADEVVAFFCQYAYAQDPTGNTISELWRERIVRNDGTRWTGRLHEHKLLTHGGVVKVPPQVAQWIHHRDHTQRSGERNLRILEQWLKDEPENSRALLATAQEYMGAEQPAKAVDAFARFLGCPGEPPDRRAQATRYMCQMLLVQGRAQEARVAALRSLEELWLWADTHLTLAESEQTLGRPDVGLVHADQALTIGKPDTLLIINPLQYTAHPLALKAICLAQLGRFEEAVQNAEQCLAIAPTYQLAGQYLPMWRGHLKKQHALGTVLALAEALVEVGELLKARDLLSLAPYYVAEEPGLIARRVQLERMIAERSGESNGVVEDLAADAFIERHLQEAA